MEQAVSSTMPKPEKHDHAAYDYAECGRYLMARDGYDERDYAGKWLSVTPAEVPYHDFWHFVLDKAPEITNDSFFVMTDAWKEGVEPWQQAILDKYLGTFGEYDTETGERFIEFYVSW